MGHGEEDGIIPRFAKELFEKAESLKLNQNDVVRKSHLHSPTPPYDMCHEYCEI